MQLYQYGTFNDIASIGQNGHLGPLPIITAKDLRESDANLAVGAAVDQAGRFLGEVTMLDKKVFVTTHGGTPRPMKDHELIGFTQFANMPPKGSQTLENIDAINPDDLIEQCKTNLPPEASGAFALRVKGHFNSISYRGMSNADSNHASFDAMEESGTSHGVDDANFSLSGVFQSGAVPDGHSPEGWHFHGLSDDHKAGGHITGFEGFHGTVEIMPIREWHLNLNSAAQNHTNPSTLLTTNQVFHIGQVNQTGARAASVQVGA